MKSYKTKRYINDLLEALDRIDSLACDSPTFQDNNNGEAEQYQKDYFALLDFLTKQND